MMTINLFSKTAITAFWQFQTLTVSECCLIRLLPYVLLLKCIHILALETASPGNQHCANCIGTLSFPYESQRRKSPSLQSSPYRSACKPQTITEGTTGELNIKCGAKLYVKLAARGHWRSQGEGTPPSNAPMIASNEIGFTRKFLAAQLS